MDLENNISLANGRIVEYQDHQNVETMREALTRFIRYLRANSGPEMSLNYIVYQAALQVLESIRDEIMPSHQEAARNTFNARLAQVFARNVTDTFRDDPEQYENMLSRLFRVGPGLEGYDDEMPGLENTLNPVHIIKYLIKHFFMKLVNFRMLEGEFKFKSFMECNLQIVLVIVRFNPSYYSCISHKNISCSLKYSRLVNGWAFN